MEKIVFIFILSILQKKSKNEKKYHNDRLIACYILRSVGRSLLRCFAAQDEFDKFGNGFGALNGCVCVCKWNGDDLSKRT